MLRIINVAALLFLITSLATADAQAQKAQGKTYAQRLVDDLMKRHSDVKGVELAVLSDKGCATLAATDQEDIGEACDDDENASMRTGEPFVEEPGGAKAGEKEDEDKQDVEEADLYDITQALHDGSGKLIGAVGFDIKPQHGQDRDAVVARAKALLLELEGQIASKEKLYERR